MNLQRIGFGYDVHRLAPGESLILGGVEIPSETGTVAHSDGDVLLHALCDALLGAIAAGDIGLHFPDTDDAWKGASSMDLLRRCHTIVSDHGFRVGNIDATIVLERPKILPYRDEMRRNISDALGIDIGDVSVKATTSERMGFVGSGEGITASCAVMLFSEQLEGGTWKKS
jgi:2-C-methyl-D-erythritol 2,4-cyclodiphosphate synthase